MVKDAYDLLVDITDVPNTPVSFVEESGKFK